MSRTVRLVSKSLAKQVDAQESDSVPYYVTSFPYSVFIIFPLNYGRIRTVGGSDIAIMYASISGKEVFGKHKATAFFC